MAGKRIYSADYNKFFDIDSKDKAYWLNFIVGDGFIYHDRYGKILKIDLHIKDIKHIQKFRKFMNSSHQIKIPKNRDSCHIQISSKTLAEDLSKYGVVPRKSLIVYYPEISSKFDSHAIRGLFDADGCIYLSKTNSLCWSICGTEHLLLKIQDIIVSELGLNRTKLYRSKTKNYCNLQYGGNIQVPKIMNWLYKDSNESIRLNRKHEKYKELSSKCV